MPAVPDVTTNAPTSSSGAEGAGGSVPVAATPPQQETTPTPSKTGFAETKQTITQGEFTKGTTPLKEVKFSSGVQKQMHNIVTSYDNDTLAGIATAKDTGTEYAPTQRDQAISELRKALDKRQSEGTQDLFYDVKEITLAISVIEDLLIQEAAALAYKLTNGGTQEGQLTLPPQLTAEIRKPFRTRAGQAIKGPFEAIGVRIKGLQGNKILFETSPLTEAWISKRIAKGDFLGNSLSDEQRTKRIEDQQVLRYEIYKSIGLDLNQVDQLSMLDLGPENFDPAAGPQARNSLFFHNQVIDHLRSLLTEYKVDSITKLSESQRIEVLLKAREQATADVAIDVGKSILAEAQSGIVKDIGVKDLQKIASDRAKGKEGTPEQIKTQTTVVEQIRANETDTQALIQELSTIDESGSTADSNTSLSAAKYAKEVAEAVYQAREARYKAKIEEFDKESPGRKQDMKRLGKEIERISKEIARLKDAKQDSDAQEAELSRIKQDLEAKQQEENVGGQINTWRQELSQLEKENIEKKTRFEQLDARRQQLVMDLGGSIEVRVKKYQDLVADKKAAETKLKEIQEGKPTEEDKTYGKAADKLYRVVTEDFNTILEAVISGKVKLEDLSDPQKGYNAVLELLWHSNSTTERTIPKDLQERMLSRFELASQIAQHYKVDLTGDPDFSTVNTLTTNIKNLTMQRDHMEKTAGTDPDALKDVKDRLELAIETYRSDPVKQGVQRILDKVLPQIGIHGRWQAVELVQKILQSKVTDTPKGFLLDPLNYEGARLVEQPPTPQAAKPEGTAETPLRKEPAGEIKIGDRKSVEHLVKRLGLEDEVIATYRDPVIFHQDFNGVDTEYAFFVKQEIPRGVLFIEGIKANEALYRKLPDTREQAEMQGWNAEIINHFYNNAEEDSKNRQQINNEVLVHGDTVNNFEEVFDITDHTLPEAGKGIKLAGYDFITSRSPQERLDLFAYFPTTSVDIAGTKYTTRLDKTLGELTVMIPVTMAGWPSRMGINDFLTRIQTTPGVNADQIEKFKQIIGTKALDTLRLNI